MRSPPSSSAARALPAIRRRCTSSGAEAAVIRLTDSLAADVGPLDVRVFALHPGGVYTGLTETILASDTVCSSSSYCRSS